MKHSHPRFSALGNAYLKSAVFVLRVGSKFIDEVLYLAENLNEHYIRIDHEGPVAK